MRSNPPRPSRVLVCVTVAAVMSAGSAAMAAADYYLKLSGVKGESKGSAAAGKEEIEIESFSWGATQTRKVSKVDALTLKQSTPAAKPTPPTVTLKRGTSAAPGGVQVAAGDLTGDGRSAAAEAHHLHKPLERGSIKVKFPWPACAEGARFDEATLRTPEATYTLHDVEVASCAAESLSLNYERITW